MPKIEYMSNNLTKKDLTKLIQAVFLLNPEDRNFAVIVDVPDEIVPDNDKWRERRVMAYHWWQGLQQEKHSLGLDNIHLFYYQNVHSNNADLPTYCYEIERSPESVTKKELIQEGQTSVFEEKLAAQQIIFAPTEFSTTAPLKVLAKQYMFRAATMPRFSHDMIPALRLDWTEINIQVNVLSALLDKSEEAEIEFVLDGSETVHLTLDLRYRSSHASGGLFPAPGIAGNLPSGESYIVPYEGEKGEDSRSQGIMPVQFENEIVQYRIENNRAVDVLTDGMFSQKEKEKLEAEPAYGNLAELGFGVLKSFGIKPIGEVLLDEKLGLHIAFGRSDHFGGATGINDFRNPENVVHIDRIYIPETQPRIQINYVHLIDRKGNRLNLMESGEYTVL